jgi:pimeloyl-ACP methyl ester carboxylesterase|tara:strand:- start:418 stop:1140 length:723 start_codon:yes stop_codon:yes gene_type:complete
MKNNKPHFLLIHGAWHGGWVWNEISEILRYQRYSVSTPTLTGLGEKKHLLSSKITIETFIEDIVNHIVFENLNNIILVGHSFAGSVISGVADRLKDRIQKLIYFDAMILIDGQKPFDISPKETVEQRIELAKKFGNNISIPAPSADAFGVFDIKKSLLLEEKLTPHPLSAFQSKLILKNEVGNGIPLSYIFCTKPVYKSLESSREVVRKMKWPIFELNAGHDAMLTHPKETLNLLMKICN